MTEKKGLAGDLESWTNLITGLDDVKVLLQMAEEEKDEGVFSEVQEQVTHLEEEVRQFELVTLMGGPHDRNDAIISINAGAGGTEAQDWANMLLRMYLRWTERRGFESEIFDIQPGEEAGIKSVTFMVRGKYAFGHFQAEAGVHRLVRISPFDSGGRRHTSFAAVSAMPDIGEEIEIEVKEEDLRIDTYRASGAGGQHVNVTDSAVRITHVPTGIVVQCQNERSQHKNKATALKLLKAKLFEKEEQEREKELQEAYESKNEIAWGRQIRSYVMHPYQMVKDHRTNFESGNVDAIMDGDLDKMIEEFLHFKAKK